MPRPPLPRVPPERLSPRARAYLAFVLGQHLVIGAFALCDTTFFAQPAFDGIKRALLFVDGDAAMQTWGVILLVVAVLCAVALVVGSEGLARAALFGSVAVEGMWLGGYVATAAAAGLTSVVGLAVWAGLIGRDLTMLRQPLKNPFEPIVRRILAEPDDPGGEPTHATAA